MKTKHYLQTIVFLCFVAAATSLARADWDAEAFVKQFNNMNGSGQGFYFVYPDDNPNIDHYPYAPELTTAKGYKSVNVDAYAPGITGITNGQVYFKSFCVEPETEAGLRKADKKTGNTLIGTLNYSGNKTTVIGGNGKSLTVGAALLYKLYATGELANYTVNYKNSDPENVIQSAIRHLMNISPSKYALNTDIRNLLYNLTGITTLAGLQASYDPGKTYDYMGDYSVFVMNVKTADTKIATQDFLYLVEHPKTDVPEPATLLLWTLGSLGALGSARRARKQLAKQSRIE